MPQEGTVKKAFTNTPEGKMSVGKLRNRRLDDIEKYLKKMAVRL
jgi:hypothetical protein